MRYVEKSINANLRDADTLNMIMKAVTAWGIKLFMRM
jgi:hypothetical protein